MSEPELVNSASEDENNETEESNISDDEYLSDFTKLQLYMHKTSVSGNQSKKFLNLVVSM